MKKSLPFNHFDHLVRDRYKEHKIPPEKELWENINSRVNQKKLNKYSRTIQRLKIAAAILALALIGSVSLYVLKPDKQDDPEIELDESSVVSDTIPENPSNSVREVVFSDQEQEELELVETDSYPTNEDSAEIIAR
ncbi:MAG: hypothetical protein U9R49_12770 [Bacteroidota bacterium]|nr:hypothetical protein [Bacteroidota bacterium]